MKRKTASRLNGNEVKGFVDLLNKVAHRHSLHTVFDDFAAMSAMAISNAVDKTQFDAREADYLQRAKRYEHQELGLIAQALAALVDGLEAGPRDFLGEAFMSLDLGDARKGQFFTPFELSELMARLTWRENEVEQLIAQRGFVRLSEPAVGAGGMVIAMCTAMLDRGINYQQHLHVVATDIDLRAVQMAYLQLSLLHVPAVVIHGNSLSSNDVRSIWRTPAHMWGRWDFKLQRAALATPGVPIDEPAGEANPSNQGRPGAESEDLPPQVSPDLQVYQPAGGAGACAPQIELF